MKAATGDHDDDDDNNNKCRYILRCIQHSLIKVMNIYRQIRTFDVVLILHSKQIEFHATAPSFSQLHICTNSHPRTVNIKRKLFRISNFAV